MAFALPTLSLGPTSWTGVDVTPDGAWLAVKVRIPRSGRGKPVVVKCKQSSKVAVGEHALAELAMDIGGGPWTMPLPRGDYQMLVMPEPPVLEAEMDASLRWSLASMIDFPIERAIVSWMRIPSEQFDPKREKQLYVIVAKDELVDEQARIFEKAHVALKAVDIRETALRNIAALLEKKQEGIGLLTVGSTGVTTTFTFRGELYLDRFIAQPMDEVLSGDSERRVKFLDRIALQVYQSLDLLSRNFPFVEVGRIVVAPAPGLDIAGHLRSKLQVSVENLDLAAVMDLSAAPELQKPETQSRFIVALGAALRGQKAGS